MLVRNRTCAGCNTVFEVATGKKIPSYNPEFYRQRGLCEDCFKDVKEFVQKSEVVVPTFRECPDVSWATKTN